MLTQREVAHLSDGPNISLLLAILEKLRGYIIEGDTKTAALLIDQVIEALGGSDANTL